MVGFDPGQWPVAERGVGGDDLVAVALDGLEQAQLDARVRASAPDREPGADRKVRAVAVEQTGHLSDLGAVAYLPVGFDRRIPRTGRQRCDRPEDRLVDRGADGKRTSTPCSRRDLMCARNACGLDARKVRPPGN